MKACTKPATILQKATMLITRYDRLVGFMLSGRCTTRSYFQTYAYRKTLDSTTTCSTTMVSRMLMSSSTDLGTINLNC